MIEVTGLFFALATLGLGILGTIPEHPRFDVGREVFGNIPVSLRVVFYLAVSGFIWLMFHLFARRATSWSLGKPETRSGNWRQRMK
ncbi:MAG: hypothetical protein ACRDZM_17625, partial [Acidimicrobiia bacterium]